MENNNAFESKFFTFLKPILFFIDTGDFFRKPFRWLYSAIAIINLILPLALLIKILENGTLKGAPTNLILVFIIVWLVMTFFFWLGFQIWWERRDRVYWTSNYGDDFVATPALSHLIQTFGEWLGMLVGGIGFTFALFSTVFLSTHQANLLSNQFGIGSLVGGVAGIILMPIIGFFIVVLFRFTAETIRAITSIANTTRTQLGYFETPNEGQ